MDFEGFVSRLQQRWTDRGNGLIVHRQVDSTQQLARLLVREYVREQCPVPDVDILAWEQSAGAGRGDHAWSSPAGVGVYTSMVRRLPSARTLQWLPMGVAVALAEALDPFLHTPCSIKWPNDLLVDGRKLGGILIDGSSRGDSEAIVIIGFGINNHLPRPEAPLEAPSATTVETVAGDAAPLDQLAHGLVTAVDEYLTHSSETSDLMTRYTERSHLRPGDPLRSRLPGGELVEGIFEGFDDQGFVLLRDDKGSRRVTAGVLETL